jgi:hypothetical protein
MKRITIGTVTGIVLTALILGVLPAIAAEPQENFPATGLDYDSSIAKAGEPLTFTISATDLDNDSLIYSASNLPPGATFDQQTRTFSWTPGYDQAGIYPNIHFEVSDGELTDSEDITITVINVDRPPMLDFIGDRLASAEELVQFTIKATDPDEDPLTYVASNLPPGATFDPQTRTFSWTPNPGQQGSYPGIRFEVSDGELTDLEDITITVQASTVKTPEEAIFSVDSLRVRPGKTNAGKQVRISVLASNIGTVTDSYEVTLRINGTIEGNKIITLSPGTTEEVNFFAVEDIAGLYTVDVNGLSGSFLVREMDNGRPSKKNSMRAILSKTVGWIRTLLNEGGDA